MSWWINIIMGLMFIIVGVYALLLAYRVVPLGTKDAEKVELWHHKFDMLMKVAGIMGITGGFLTMIGVLITKCGM